jgi:hypothetical protein
MYCQDLKQQKFSIANALTKNDKHFYLTPWSRFHFEKLTEHSATQEISLLLWNLKVHYCVHKSL